MAAAMTPLTRRRPVSVIVAEPRHAPLPDDSAQRARAIRVHVSAFGGVSRRGGLAQEHGGRRCPWACGGWGRLARECHRLTSGRRHPSSSGGPLPWLWFPRRPFPGGGARPVAAWESATAAARLPPYHRVR